MKQSNKKQSNKKQRKAVGRTGNILLLSLLVLLLLTGCGKDDSMVLTQDGSAVEQTSPKQETEEKTAPSDASKEEKDEQNQETGSEPVLQTEAPADPQGEGDPEDTESESVPQEETLTEPQGEGDPEDTESQTVPAVPQGEGDPEDFESESIPESDTSRGKTSSPVDIVVYICGEVQTPGVVVLQKKARVYEAIRAAGGLTDHASMEAVNQAAVLEDEMMIRIPSKEEYEEALAKGEEMKVMSFGVSRQTEGASAKDTSQKTEGTSGTDASHQLAADPTSGDGKININTADTAGLKEIPGIGESKAEAIVEYRSRNGSFQSIEEITKVNGIKKGTLDKIKEYITVS